MWESRTLQQRYLIYFVFPMCCLLVYLASMPIFGRWELTIQPGTWWTFHLPMQTQPREPPAEVEQPGEVPPPVVPIPTQPHVAENPRPLFGHFPMWHQILSGAGGVPSAVEVPGDLAYIDGVVDRSVTTIPVSLAITNSAQLRAAYSDCLIPIRLWSTVDRGAHWTDVTDLYLNQQRATSMLRPYYLSCSGPAATFEVPVITSYLQRGSHLYYEVSVDTGGNFASSSGARIAPLFRLQARTTA